MTRIYLVDDHAIVREGLRAVLVNHGHQVVGEAADVPSAIEGILHSEPQVVLLDLGLQGRSGLDLIARLQQRQLDVKVVMLTMSSQPRHVSEAWRLGANAYVLKGSHSSTVLNAIAAAQNGTRFLDPALSQLNGDLVSGSTPEDRLAGLSLREREVMLMVVNGLSSAAIGGQLSLSPKTVDTYRSRLMQKLGVSDVTSLVRLAVREGVIDGELMNAA
jgi:two-component system, NarL family, invasion response regulator UvrY